ncbi:MAG: hypothetical protein GDA36_03520 [Rhodobacteraceae bacterium]|nr:hypothetical protein [Paracoccaceae bacterium]
MAMNPARAQGDAISTRNAAITKVATKYGPQIVKQLQKDTEFSVPVSTIPAERRNIAIEETYHRYVEMRSSYHMLVRKMQGNGYRLAWTMAPQWLDPKLL